MKKVKVLAYLTLCCLFFNSVMADEMEPGYVNDSYISTDIVENDNNDLYIDDDEEQEKLIEETSILDESILEDTTEVEKVMNKSKILMGIIIMRKHPNLQL